MTVFFLLQKHKTFQYATNVIFICLLNMNMINYLMIKKKRIFGF